jgi:hypothetical protein
VPRRTSNAREHRAVQLAVAHGVTAAERLDDGRSDLLGERIAGPQITGQHDQQRGRILSQLAPADRRQKPPPSPTQ